MSSGEPDTRHTFRQRGSVVLGAVCVVACLGMFLGSLPSTNLVFAAAMFFGASWAFVLLVRPSLQLSVIGVHVNNPMRRTTIPWPLVDEALARWNLQVYAGQQVVTAWAISSTIERPRGTGSYGGRLLGRALPPTDPTSAAPKGMSAPAIARLIEEGRRQWREEVAAGMLVVDEGHAQVVRVWSWLDAVLLAAPVLMLLAGVLSG